MMEKDGVVAALISVGSSVDAVAPPYTTATVPIVAKTIASSRLGSHLSLNTLTLMRYTKKALVFPIALKKTVLQHNWIRETKVIYLSHRPF